MWSNALWTNNEKYFYSIVVLAHSFHFKTFQMVCNEQIVIDIDKSSQKNCIIQIVFIYIFSFAQ